MQLREVFEKTVAHFKKVGYATARLDAELLLSHALGWDRLQIYLKHDYPLNAEELESCRQAVRRRNQGEPVAYICGERGFYKHNFLVEPGVLIPRPETELIVEKTLSVIPVENCEDCKIVEFGVGSGCIGLSILAERPHCQVLGFDISQKATEIALLNAQRLSVQNRYKCLTEDIGKLTAAWIEDQNEGLADIIVANPPYIAIGDSNLEPNVARFEPAEALFADDYGLAKIREWVRLAAQLLKPKGIVIFEIGYKQGNMAEAVFIEAGLNAIERGKDLAGLERWVLGKRL